LVARKALNRLAELPCCLPQVEQNYISIHIVFDQKFGGRLRPLILFPF
jgi:hypothetical protein